MISLKTTSSARVGSEEKLAQSLDHLRTTIEMLPHEYPYAFHPSKKLIFSYLKGIVTGLGALSAVAIIVPLILWMLQGIQWVPLVGDFVMRVSERVEETQK